MQIGLIARRPAARVLAVALSVLVVACAEDLTTPHRAKPPVVEAPKPATDVTTYPNESPASIVIQLVINDTNGQGRVDPSFVQQVYKHSTWVQAVASGNVIGTPNFAGFGSVTTYGPIGNTGISWIDNTGSSGGMGFDTSDTKYVLFVHNSKETGASSTAYGIGNAINAYPPGGGGPVTCGPQYMAPLCVTYTGNRQVTLTRVDASLNFVADSTNVVPGSTVHFTALAVPSMIGGQPTPVEIDSIYWVADDPTQGGEPTDNSVGSGTGLYGTSDTKQIIGSGTMHVVAYVNGKRQEGQVHITTPTLTLQPQGPYIRAGQNVTFAPTWSDGHPTLPDMWTWQWTPDTPPSNGPSCGYWEDPCTKPVQQSGTMKVTVRRNGVFRTASTHVIVYSVFTLDADYTSVYQGDTVTFTPKHDGVPGPAARWRWAPSDASSDRVACDGGITNCTKAIYGPGVMWA